jgi:hypothetical protein
MGIVVVASLRALLLLQVARATITGTVRDETTGQPRSGVVVALTDLQRATLTDRDGRYRFHSVPPGPQHLSVGSIGYKSRTLHALVAPDVVLELNISLRAEPIVLDAVALRPQVILPGIEDQQQHTRADRSISLAAMRNHPSLSEPDPFQALAGAEVTLQPEAAKGLHIRGGQADHTGYILDGIPVFSPYHAGGVFSAWNPDALQRVELSAAAPAPTLPNVLSGIVAAVTRTPGQHLQTRGSLSSTQARLTVDGQVTGRAGYLLSLRTGFPDLLSPRDEATYLGGETSDWLGKLELAALGGHARVIAYENENEIDAAVVANADQNGPRNAFGWQSRSVGAQWSRSVSGAALRVLGWSASSTATARWQLESGPSSLNATRRDLGAQFAIEWDRPTTFTQVGFRLEQSRTAYALDGDTAIAWSMRDHTPSVSGFAQHARSLDRRVELVAGASITAAAHDLHLSPRLTVRAHHSDQVTVSASIARTQQFVQSVRNPESLVGQIFPADLYVGANGSDVPVARSDQAVLAAEYQPRAGIRLVWQTYARRLYGIALVAPRTADPFTTGSFARGSGTAAGMSVEAALSFRRYGLMGSYAWQRVRFSYEDSTYVPDHGAAHVAEAGAIYFPTASSSIRLGASALFARRVTSLTEGLEWEACNLIDQGCEFAGTPRYAGQLGGTTLPAYLRIDLGVRKHWHKHVAGRDAVLALFGTLTNLTARKNVLTYGRDPLTGQRIALEMRPFAPLVAGLDWIF